MRCAQPGLVPRHASPCARVCACCDIAPRTRAMPLRAATCSRAHVCADAGPFHILLRRQATEADADKKLGAKELGEMGKALSDEDKAPYAAKAAELKAAYDAANPPSKAEQKKAAGAEVSAPGVPTGQSQYAASSELDLAVHGSPVLTRGARAQDPPVLCVLIHIGNTEDRLTHVYMYMCNMYMYVWACVCVCVRVCVWVCVCVCMCAGPAEGHVCLHALHHGQEG